MKPIAANWYDYPQYYDIAFQDETGAEADFIEAACREYCGFPVRRLIEPGCGSGRMVIELARRGFAVTGFDICQPSLDFLRRELVHAELQAAVLNLDMADFRLNEPADAAYCMWNTFRHLTSEASAQRHLQCVARSLRVGGIYLLGLHLLPPDAAEECTERWKARRGRVQVTTTLRVIASDRRRRLETLRVSLLVRRGHAQPLRLRTEFLFRLYTAKQLRTLLARVPEFELCDVFDFWFEIEAPLKLTNELADVVLVLRKRAGR